MRVMLTKHASYAYPAHHQPSVEVQRSVVVKTSARFFVTDLMEWKVSPMVVARCEEELHPENNNCLVKTNG